jgi:hypothetical protein
MVRSQGRTKGQNEMTLQKAAQNALAVQDACNSRGIARSMVEAMDAVAESGTSANTHPVTYLFLYQLMALAGFEPLGSYEQYGAAKAACEILAV